MYDAREKPLDIILVPLWLETLLQAHHAPLETVLDAEKLSSIVSSEDLEKYYEAQWKLGLWVPGGLGRGEAIEGINNQEMSLTDRKRKYLYGELMEADGNPDPAFKVCRVGYDTLVVTVDQSSSFNLKDLMESLVEQWRATHPLERLASHPLFTRWLQLQ